MDGGHRHPGHLRRQPGPDVPRPAGCHAPELSCSLGAPARDGLGSIRVRTVADPDRGRDRIRRDRRVGRSAEASTRRSVSRVLSRGPCGAAGMAIHLGRRSPDGSCGLPEGWAAPLSPTRGFPRAGCALLFDLAPGRVCRVSLRSNGLRHRPASSLWHWSSPHGGRALPATLRLRSSDFPHVRRVAPSDARPSDHLADRLSLPCVPSHARPAA